MTNGEKIFNNLFRPQIEFWLIGYCDNEGELRIATVWSIEEGRELWTKVACHKNLDPIEFELRQDGKVLYKGNWATDEC